MNPVLANEEELYFERGGPAYRLMQRIGIVRGGDPSVRRRIVGFLAVTWVPLLVLALIEGRALGPTPRESFLLDFATYARFFVGIPILVLAEVVVGPRLAAAGLQFVRGGFVRPCDYPAFDRAIAQVAKRRESRWAELIILGLAVAASWWTVTEIAYGDGARTWRSTASTGDSGSTMSYAGLWYRFVATPVMQFFWYRWLWRLLIWALFLWTVSRLDLDLVATHADQAGGLGFLGTAHTSLGIFAVALSSVASAEVGFLLVFQGAHIDTFKVPFVVLLGVVQLMFLGPLLIFVPILVRTRQAWMTQQLATATLAKRLTFARTFFHTARKHRLIDENPFVEVKIPSADISARQSFVSRDAVQKVLAIADPTWRTIIALSRFGGLRCPSEVLSLEWTHVDWDRSRVTVPSPKTDRYAGKESREIPLFPELRPFLEEAFKLADTTRAHVIGGNHLAKANSPTGWKNCNLRTSFAKLVARAGVELWPRLFHNMRSSRETELLDSFAVPVVAQWMGHDPKVCVKHYAQTTDEHFRRATGGAESGAQAAQNPAQQAAAGNRGEKKAYTEKEEREGVNASPCESLLHAAQVFSGECGIRYWPFQQLVGKPAV